MVVIPLGKSMGGGLPRVDLRDQSFHLAEGWDIREILPGTGVFSLLCEGMDGPVTVGGYGYSYVCAPEPVVLDEPKPRKKR
jgi:hypothetical protein